MADFPQDLIPMSSTWPKFPTGQSSWSFSGKGQFRSVTNVGRTWSETYPPFHILQNPARGFIAKVQQLYRDVEVFDKYHFHLGFRTGTETNNITINGANQTGNSINTTGWSTANDGAILLGAGNIIKIAGLNLVHDLYEDVIDTGSTTKTIKINPPIFSGGSPVNGAAITMGTTSESVKFRAIITNLTDMPKFSGPREWYTGFTIDFKEAP